MGNKILQTATQTPPFRNKSPQWHNSILLKCLFFSHSLSFPASYLSINCSHFHCLLSVAGHNIHVLIFSATTYIVFLASSDVDASHLSFWCLPRRAEWVTKLAPRSMAAQAFFAWHVVVVVALVHFSCMSLPCCGSNDKCWWLKPSRL